MFTDDSSLKIEEFYYKIEHGLGTSMHHADVLNRNPVECFKYTKNT